MDSHDRMLGAFLAGDLEPADGRRWDEHLLACERCWRAVREDRAARQAAELLRQPAPPGLADRVAFAVELAAATGTGSRQRSHRRGPLRWGWLVAGGVVAALAVIAAVLLPPGGHAGVPPAVAAVARYAQTLPPPQQQGRGTGLQEPPVEVGHRESVTAGGQQIVVRTWRLGGVEAVVAVSGHPFPMPPGAQGASGRGMAWSMRLGKLGLYCLNGQPSVLVAAPVTEAELTRLASRLPQP